MGGDQTFESPLTKMRSPRGRRGMVADDNNASGSNRERGWLGIGGSQTRSVAKKDTTADTGIILCLEHKKSSGLRDRKAGLNNDQECMILEMDQKLQPNNPSLHKKESTGRQRSNRRKRGRPRKVLVNSLIAAANVPNENGAREKIVVEDSIMGEVGPLFASDPMLVKGVEGNTPAKDSLSPYSDCQKLTDNPSNQIFLSTGTSDRSSVQMSRSNGEGSNSQHQRQISKRANRQTSSAKDDSQAQENTIFLGHSSDNTKVKKAESVCITKEAKMGSKRGRNMLDDQPLSKWFEKMQSAGSSAVGKQHTESMKLKEKELIKGTTDGDNNEGAIIASHGLETQTPTIGTASLSALRESKLPTESMKVKEKEPIKDTPDGDNNEDAAIASDAVDTQTPVVGTKSVGASREPELPFVKNTSLWAVVESMEVFLKMPQKPHFRPLLKRKESSRQGFAIATMVNFCSTVESISKLQIDDPKEKIDDILESLSDLETHGFSVQALRDRVSELLSIKENHEQLRAEVDDINQKVTLCGIQKSEQDKEMNEISVQIKKLEEMIAKAKSIKELKDGEIGVLESRRQDVEEALRRSRSCYEELTSALLGSC